MSFFDELYPCKTAEKVPKYPLSGQFGRKFTPKSFVAKSLMFKSMENRDKNILKKV